MTTSRVQAAVRLAVLGIALATAAPARATEWFVAPGGSGTGSNDAPFGRIQEAINAAQAGDTVTVRAGTYNESLRTTRAGTAKAPITLRAATPRAAIVTATGRVLSVEHPYFVVDGIVFDGQYGSSRTISVTSAANFWVLRNAEVRRSGRDCVSLSAPAGVLVENSLIHHCLNSAGGRTDAHGITGGAIQGLTIRGTEIHTFSGDAIQFDPSRSAPGWTDLTIEDCYIWLAPLSQAENGFPAGTVTGENALDTKTYVNGPRARVTVRNTVASGFRGGLIADQAAFNLKENIDALVDRVTVFDSEIAFRLRGPTSGVPHGAWVTVQSAVIYRVDQAIRYEDNIENPHIWNTTLGLGVARPFNQASSSGTTVDVKNVLVVGSSLPREAAGASNMAVGTSVFVNAAGGDYRLVARATPIDSGITLSTVRHDRDGVSRPQWGVSGNYYDIGAYEWCPGSECSATLPPPSPTPSPTPSASAMPGNVTATPGPGSGQITVHQLLADRAARSPTSRPSPTQA
jgi:hypothetical protein